MIIRTSSRSSSGLSSDSITLMCSPSYESLLEDILIKAMVANKIKVNDSLGEWTLIIKDLGRTLEDVFSEMANKEIFASHYDLSMINENEVFNQLVFSNTEILNWFNSRFNATENIHFRKEILEAVRGAKRATEPSIKKSHNEQDQVIIRMWTAEHVTIETATAHIKLWSHNGPPNSKSDHTVYLYCLNPSGIHQRFNDLSSSMMGWTLLGSHELVNQNVSASCAPLAYQILNAGGLSKELESSSYTTNSTRITVDHLMTFLNIAKVTEREEYQEIKKIDQLLSEEDSVDLNDALFQIILTIAIANNDIIKPELSQSRWELIPAKGNPLLDIFNAYSDKKSITMHDITSWFNKKYNSDDPKWSSRKEINRTALLQRSEAFSDLKSAIVRNPLKMNTQKKTGQKNIFGEQKRKCLIM